ncbi:hypothetical protein HM1_1292 [Heliomicrobium modesticaldum Ice1]|uniref:Uncharacterized protein n=1 Tax=Heliobacterium modesticaldum (strain ATCC 51547 / Ice1) TaxID=498761 RepID=B0TGM4_HELMI|nr:hypothetical protein HM1_1292 [Heliomicrobium modesticaldum Ice1]
MFHIATNLQFPKKQAPINLTIYYIRRKPSAPNLILSVINRFSDIFVSKGRLGARVLQDLQNEKWNRIGKTAPDSRL